MDNSVTSLPHDIVKNLQRVRTLEEAGNFTEAAAILKKMVQKHPNHPVALHCAGIIALKQRDPAKALEYLTKAIQANPNDPSIYNHTGVAYCASKDLDSGILNYQKAVLLSPSYGEAHYNLALALTHKNETTTAITHYKRAIELKHIAPQVYFNYGNALQMKGLVDEAIVQYQNALKMHPNYIECYFNLAAAFQNKNRFEDALSYYQKAYTLNPNYFEAYHDAGTVLVKLKKYKEAIQYFDQALAIKPDHTTFIKISNLYRILKEYTNAIATHRRALEHFPDNAEHMEAIINDYKTYCDWDEVEHWKQLLDTLADKCLAEDLPFSHFCYAWSDFPAEKQLAIAKNVAKHYFSKKKRLREQLQISFPPRTKKKIRIGYLSADIRNHPTAHLMMNMFTYHNRDRFEIYLYSIGPKDDSIYCQRIPTLCDHYRDFEDTLLDKCVKQINAEEIDILIDTMGHTQLARVSILELRPAPIQMCFLGFPGTMGAEFIDYLVTDPVVVPDDHAHWYSESLFYMPHAYFVTDDQQPIAEKPTRKAFGLPNDKFIFSCFNGQQKINAKVFDAWMRILKQAPEAVLWLYSTNTIAEENLRKEAEKRGIANDRIFFAHRLSKAEHLARIQLADLFLDCFTVNAHTTAIDALWSGVPVITCPGKTIASRGASSILMAIELPELIAKDEQDYESMALYYARNPEALKLIREKIAKNRKTTALFDTKQYVKDFEAGLEKIWQLYQEGKPPETIRIASL